MAKTMRARLIRSPPRPKISRSTEAPPWSPASRDPRFSRRTPDALRGRIDKAGGQRSWLAAIVAGKARKQHICSAQRKQMIIRLESMAEAAEQELKPAAAASSQLQLIMDSPATAAKPILLSTKRLQSSRRRVRHGVSHLFRIVHVPCTAHAAGASSSHEHSCIRHGCVA